MSEEEFGAQLRRVSTYAHAALGISAGLAGVLRIHGILDDVTADHLRDLLAGVEAELPDGDPATGVLARAVQSLSFPSGIGPATRSDD